VAHSRRAIFCAEATKQCSLSAVITGLVPVIHVLLSFLGDKDVDSWAFATPKRLWPRRRVKHGHYD
jgi:hypothetical protein